MKTPRARWASIDVDSKRAVFVAGTVWTALFIGALTLFVTTGEGGALIAWALPTVGFAVLGALTRLATRLFPRAERDVR